MTRPSTTESPVGIYIHVPFCVRKCPYCDFYSVPVTDQAADRYVEAVVRALSNHPFGGLRADTLYFGGGTPALLGGARLGRIVAAAVDAFGLEDGEITVEANPAGAMKSELAALRAAGVNRVSFGVQSLDDRELAALGRLHDAETARQAILDAADAGFQSISADLMLAVPGQTKDSLAASIDALSDLPVTHISAYLLKVEPGTDFSRQAERGALHLPDEDATAELYLQCVDRLGGRGFTQYEISNFARDGNTSRHNLKYWRCRPYLGIGPAAHSFLNGERFFFPRDLEAFTAAGQPFDLLASDGAGGGWEEELMLRLRLTEGAGLDGLLLPEGAVHRVLDKAKLLQHHGLTTVEGATVALTPAGFLLSNSVTSALLAAAQDL